MSGKTQESPSKPATPSTEEEHARSERWVSYLLFVLLLSVFLLAWWFSRKERPPGARNAPVGSRGHEEPGDRLCGPLERRLAAGPSSQAEADRSAGGAKLNAVPGRNPKS
jgi:hypothetical protein